MANQTLRGIVDTACLLTNRLTLEDIDTSGLANIEVQGYSIGAATTAKATLDQLIPLFQLYTTETNDVLKFARLADSPNAGVINLGDCGVRQDNAKGGGTVTIRPETDLPRKLELRFSDPALEYRDNVAAAYRLTANSEKTSSIQAPLVVPFERAEQICKAALEMAWAAQTTTEVQVPVRYSHIEAGDTVELDGSLWHVTRLQFSAPTAIRLSLARFSYAPLSRITAPSIAEVYVPPVVVPPQPVAVPLDIQLLSAETDYSGFYCVAYEPVGKKCGPSASLVVENVDGGFDTVAVIPVGAVAGQSASALPAGVATTYDAAGSVTVSLVSTGSLAGCTYELAAAGKNRALLGDELIAFTGCSYSSSTGLYTLTGLIRGLGGTAPGAASGSRFVLLTAAMTSDVPLPYSKTGISLEYKLLGSNAPEGTAVPFSLVNTNQRLRPLCPISLTSSGDAAARVMGWTRQARKNYVLTSEAGVPLDFANERYELELLDAAGATVATHNTTTPALTVATGAATAFRVRQLGDLLPGAWSTPLEF